MAKKMKIQKQSFYVNKITLVYKTKCTIFFWTKSLNLDSAPPPPKKKRKKNKTKQKAALHVDCNQNNSCVKVVLDFNSTYNR